ncbi:drug/metabolite transporter, DME family [Desulfotomaculum arcticum]|uniref:Drug/metabolite transporter, DME family n=1 Tax=Desulfotruncus arcticus DSM 17038 TaxID=1121424 RepID=A0A1I2UPN0_9FIRM|nr:EamA family transporter [Desulfotruncus arcticus]SFG79105.1 drug/metabolite transporter, DME family [Desulfotomaculum arcticum] [Desulfotruncus arcticus DSM 17038]
MNREMAFGLLLIVIAAVFFGTTGTAATYLHSLYGVDPLTVGVWRVFFGAPFLFVASLLTTRETGLRIYRSHSIGFLIFGIAVAGYQLSFFQAVIRTQIATATLLTICVAPLLVAFLARVFLKERLTSRILAALALALPGTVLILGLHGAEAILTPSYLFGNLLALAAALSYATTIVTGKGLTGSLPPIQVMAMSFGTGALLLLPFAGIPQHLPLAGWLILLYLGLFPTAISYALLGTGLKKATATSSSIAVLVEPLVATLLAVGFVGERLTMAGWVGAVLLLASLVVLTVPARRISRSEEKLYK